MQLLRRQLFARPANIAGSAALWFASPAHVPGAEHEFLHRKVLRQVGKMFPRLDERISKQGVPHQPHSKRQENLSHPAGGRLAIHDDDAATRTQDVPGMLQHDTVVRHGVVGKPEQNPVERLGRHVLGSIAPGELDIVPALAFATRTGPGEHAGGDIHAIDTARRADHSLQRRKVAS